MNTLATVAPVRNATPIRPARRTRRLILPAAAATLLGVCLLTPGPARAVADTGPRLTPITSAGGVAGFPADADSRDEAKALMESECVAQVRQSTGEQGEITVGDPRSVYTWASGFLDGSQPSAQPVDTGDWAATVSSGGKPVGLALEHSRPSTETPALAESLYVLAVYLYTAGQLQESFAMAWEAIDIYRQLVRTNPAPHTADLARALNILTLNLSRAGRAHEALAAVQEAVTFYRSLAQVDPAAYKPDLAACLHNLATCLGDVGDRSAALAAIRETAAIRRELAERDPATHAPALAPCLHRLAKRLAEAGHRGESLQTAREAVAAYRSLVRRRPEDFGQGLAGALRTYASVLEWAGKEADAARIRRESEAATEQRALEDSIRGF